MSIFNVDQGENFGRWEDSTSRYMYETSFDEYKHLLTAHETDTVADFGGANGLVRDHFGQRLTTVDIDPSKKPDVVANILEHTEFYNVVFMRYVTHYLTDQELLGLFKTVNCERMYIVQFVNEDLRTKYANSHNEVKYFRTYSQLMALLPENSSLLWSREYTVTEMFYKNRLKLEGAEEHQEDLVLVEVLF